MPGALFNRRLRREHLHARRRVSDAVAAGDVVAVVGVFRELGGDDRHRSVRIDILRKIGDIDQPAATSALRDAIDDEDAWVALAALDVIAKRQLTELRPAVRAAEQDPRMGVAKYAQWVGDRLDKRRRPA